MTNQDTCEFDLMRLAPELQVKVFEALPSPLAVLDLALTCRALNTLFATYRTQIIAAIRNNIVAPFYEYYALLGRLHIPKSDIKHPPAGGWPNITPEDCAGFGKSDFVVDVLRHLPYIVEYRPGETTRHDIAYHCEVKDYSIVTRKDFGCPVTRFGTLPQVRPALVDRHCVFVAQGYGGGGISLLLDTSTGLVLEQSAIEPRRDDAPLHVQEYFALKMRQCRELRQVFVPGESATKVDRDEEVPSYDAAAIPGEPMFGGQFFGLTVETDKEWVRHLYRKFGWPGEDWRREEGLKAIAEYRDRRNAEAYEKADELRRSRHEALQQLGPTFAALRYF